MKKKIKYGLIFMGIYLLLSILIYIGSFTCGWDYSIFEGMVSKDISFCKSEVAYNILFLVPGLIVLVIAMPGFYLSNLFLSNLFSYEVGQILGIVFGAIILFFIGYLIGKWRHKK